MDKVQAYELKKKKKNVSPWRKENLKQKSEKDVGNTFSNKISGSQKTSNETSDISEVEDSSDLSCEEEEL